MDLRRVIGSTVVFPDSLEYYSGLGRYNNITNPKANLLIWYDSTMCSGCKLSDLDHLSFVESFCHDSLKNVNVTIIFSPLIKLVEPFRDVIPKAVRNYPIYLDSCQYFYRANPRLPKNPKLHTILLDKDSRVIFCGDPMLSPNLWETYKKKLYNLTSN